jgi:hypothetical protein
MEMFDIWNQAHYQRLVMAALQTRIERENPVVRQMVSVTLTTEDKISLARGEVKAFGYAKPKAFGATPPIYVPKIRYSETEVELLPIHEMSPIDERLFRRLQSEDPKVRMRAGADAVLRGTALQYRNEVGWDVMTMNAIMTGQLNVLFKDEKDAGFSIDYGYDPTHFVIVPVSWATIASSKPITDMRAVQLLLSNGAGDFGVHFWMNSNTMRGVVESAQAKELLTGNDRGQYIPLLNDVKTRMYEPDRVQFHVSDSGYRNETYDRGPSAHVKHIPDGKIIVTTDDPFEGEPLVEVFDGMTAVPVSEFRPPAYRQGPQNWIKLDTDALTTFYHFASTRVPRINRPECIAIMDVQGVPAG